ncbi:putative gamma-glutamylcyclotransferase CG2811 [Bactrocera oleae]|uniref:putative gamma-glutamylcyclotransferase CG2811 n=1 Tax=Bactrocera oleae TaxID=104688 RepID=UPI0006B6E968|nr:putative gamma-glutamylcyclotransferase CG2811 isoform X1 [Bactrocera oleae]XP_014087301.1 putative gamma-glutamylcyclotransferase CG2811 isoform X1 [Bactrocera oleae]XP_036218428.1 putative gamma-glutamylcyclotransferase CG2811 isoform X1 [Bactrocera oleae]
MSTKMSGNLIKVFVYGTLKRGEPNHHWLTRSENGHSRFLCEAQTVVKFPLVIGTRYNIPFLLNKPGVGYNVYGEVYEVDDTMFANLDVLEDYPNYYDREIQQIKTEKNEYIDCWLYLIKQYPDQLLFKRYLEKYNNSETLPYCESYLDSSKEDMYVQDELNHVKDETK